MFKIKSKFLLSVYIFVCFLIILILVYVAKRENEILRDWELFTSIKRSRTSEPFVITICKDNTSKMENQNQRQMDQTYVLLKSAALLANKILRFIILVEEDDVFNEILARIENWPGRIRNKIILEKGQVWYPKSVNMKNMFRTCATERLFLHEALPSEDSVVHLDTDILFLKPPEEMLKEFSQFDSVQISGLSPCLYLYDNSHHDIPHYGKTGLNAGVWMMNLTRMKNFPGGWTNECINIVNEYKTHLRYADQDIANIIFSKNPKALYELACQWNFRDNICNKNRNPCKGVEHTGIYLLHGCAYAFYEDHNQKIKVMFNEFLNFDVERPLKELLQSIKTSLKNIDYSKSPSKCTKLPNFDKMLTTSLEKSIYL
ncbi:UNVERIFIED_CONTAM: hypothetical protein RMT77_005766 [Armadillidium vulgare]